MLVGIQADHQHPVDFAGFKSLAPFELAIDPRPGPTQLRRFQPLADVAKGVMADLILVAHPLLPLRQLSFLFQLQKTGDVDHFPQDQAQPHSARGDFGLGAGIGETPGQPRQMKLFLRIGNELAQLGKVGVIHLEVLRVGAGHR